MEKWTDVLRDIARLLYQAAQDVRVRNHGLANAMNGRARDCEQLAAKLDKDARALEAADKLLGTK